MLVQYCQGLVTIDETTETVRFSHFTVKEFLYKHYQDELLSVVDCAKVYLTYMNFDVFEMGPCANVDNYKQRIEDYQFSEYVVLYWGSYTKDRGEKDSDVRGILCKFFRSPGKRAAVRQIQLLFQYPLSSIMRYKLWQLGEDDLNVWTPLHTLANEGLDIFYERITTSGNAAITDGDLRGIEFGTLHSRDEQGCLPLGAASVPGHLTIVTLMIENGADVCAKDNYGSTALHRAAEEGHVEVVKVLIDNDAEINAKDNDGETALHGAAWYGHGTVISLLCNTLDTSQEAADSVLDDGFSDVIRSLNFLTTKFPEDHIFWEALGNEFLRREMYNDAVNSYDTSVHKLVTGAGIDIECLEFPLSCDECTQLVNGYHYKCKSCPWNTDYCQKCVQDGLEDHQHPVEDLLMIPSQWPLSPHEEEGSTS